MTVPFPSPDLLADLTVLAVLLALGALRLHPRCRPCAPRGNARRRPAARRARVSG